MTTECIEKLKIRPTSAGYVATHGSDVLSIDLEGGLSRSRRARIGDASTVRASWIGRQQKITQVMRFFRAVAQGGVARFRVDLILDCGNLTEYCAKLRPETTSITRARGNLRELAAELEVEPIAFCETYDATMVVLGDAFSLEGRKPNWQEDAVECLTDVGNWVNTLLPAIPELPPVT